MKVICDNCRAVYKIPDEKLVKPVNKATCRQCGHRMLIPRPRMDADPDERTLVTAVPPTPAPAPPRGEFNDDPPTHPGGRNPTPSRGRDVELHTATPAPVQSASGAKPRGRRQHTETTQPPVAAASTAHDPATDMSIAFMGVLVALMGAFALAVVPLIQSMLPDWLSPIVTSLGLMVASGGSLLALFVMLTGARGRQPAKPLISFTLAVILAFLIGLIPSVPMFVSTALSTPNTVATPSTPAVPASPPEPPDNATTETATAANTAGTDNAKSTTPAQPPKTITSESKQDSSSSRSRRSSESSDRSRSRSSSSRSSEPRAADEPKSSGRSTAPERDELDFDDEDELDLPDDILTEAPPAKPPAPVREPVVASSSGGSSSALPNKPPIGAIDMMVKSNVSVKKCFFKHQSAKGALPPRIDVRFTIKPDGTATKVGIKQVEYAATDLDFCLGSAIKGIRFPPSNEGVSLTFPFQFS